MHEFSVADAVRKVVVETAKRRGAKRVIEVRVMIGALSHLNDEQLSLCYLALAEEEPLLKNSKFLVEKEEARLKCEKCEFEGRVKADSIDRVLEKLSLGCPSCGGRLRIEGDAECKLTGLKIEV